MNTDGDDSGNSTRRSVFTQRTVETLSDADEQLYDADCAANIVSGEF
ncbi:MULTISPECIES: hypothetical protein [Haloferax]|nr:hypothetical protein [Haloferax mediterranei]MDX5987719.1 hypothetical protein [Haloferax mediterranei ATCC 33500]